MTTNSKNAKNTNTTATTVVETNGAAVNTSAPVSAPKKVEAFYLKPAAGETATPSGSLWINTVTTKGAPDYDGTINGQRVALRARKAEKGTFLSITRSLAENEIKEDGYKEEQIGTANIVINDRGFPILGIKLNSNPGKTIWFSVSKNVPHDMLVESGMNETILAEKKAAYELAKAAKAAEKETAAA